MKSWKIGAVSGLIAGIVAGIVAFLNGINMYNFGLWAWIKATPDIAPVMHIAIVEITINVIWGIILGIFFSKIYDLLPGKHITKGLLYGLFLGFIVNIRQVALNLAYAQFSYAVINITPILPNIIYGLVLGVFYEFLMKKYHPSLKKLKPSKYDIGKGVQAGAIAGLIGAIVMSFAHMIFWDPLEYPKLVTDIEFLTSQLGAHTLINMGFCAVFGVLYAKFYDRIPGKNISKGIIFAMIIFFIVSFRFVISNLLYLQLSWAIGWSNAIYLFLIFGIILGYLYKPTKRLK